VGQARIAFAGRGRVVEHAARSVVVAAAKDNAANFDQRFLAKEEQLDNIPTFNYVAAIGRIFRRGRIAEQVVEGRQGLAVEQGSVSTRVYPTNLCNGSQSQVRKDRNFSQDEECQLRMQKNMWN
jgi:hypothetical protein